MDLDEQLIVSSSHDDRLPCGSHGRMESRKDSHEDAQMEEAETFSCEGCLACSHLAVLAYAGSEDSTAP